MRAERWIVMAALAAAGCGDDHGHTETDAGAPLDHIEAADDVVATDGGITDAPRADVPAGATPVVVRFAAKVGAMPFACGQTYPGLGSANSTWNPLDFRLYVHDVRLLDAIGNEVPVTLEQDGTWQHEGVALLDFEDRTGLCSNGTAPTNLTVRGSVSRVSTWTGLRFRVGVPFALNHADIASKPSPLNLTGLWWNWQGGHKFLRIDGRTQDATGTVLVQGWNIHLGSTGCDGSSSGGVTRCMNPNRPEVTLMNFDPATNTVVADLARLVSGTDLSRSNADPGCMSTPGDSDCASLFPALGLPFGSAPAAQTFFRVE